MIVRSLLCALLVAAFAANASAQRYPQIKPIKTLRLDTKQLEKLQVYYTDSRAFYIETRSKRQQTSAGLRDVKSYHLIDVQPSIVTGGNGAITPTRKAATTTPRFVTVVSANGQVAYFRNFLDVPSANASSDYVPSLTTFNDLIGVEFPLKADDGTESIATLWYYPTNALFAAIPKKDADEIKAEMKWVDTVVSNTPENTYTTSTANTFWVQNVSIGPNPAAGADATLYFTTTAPRSIDVHIYDQTGKFITTVTQRMTFTIEKAAVNIPLSGLPNGMYMVVIHTDMDEYYAERLIVVR